MESTGGCRAPGQPRVGAGPGPSRQPGSTRASRATLSGPPEPGCLPASIRYQDLLRNERRSVMKRAAVLLFLAAALWIPAFVSAKEVKPPKVLEAVNPEYTAEARAAAVEGKVVLDLTVCDMGKVKDVEVVEP